MNSFKCSEYRLQLTGYTSHMKFHDICLDGATIPPRSQPLSPSCCLSVHILQLWSSCSHGTNVMTFEFLQQPPQSQCRTLCWDVQSRQIAPVAGGQDARETFTMLWKWVETSAGFPVTSCGPFIESQLLLLCSFQKLFQGPSLMLACFFPVGFFHGAH